MTLPAAGEGFHALQTQGNVLRGTWAAGLTRHICRAVGVIFKWQESSFGDSPAFASRISLYCPLLHETMPFRALFLIFGCLLRSEVQLLASVCQRSAAAAATPNFSTPTT
jgi:hypothetical protein